MAKRNMLLEGPKNVVIIVDEDIASGIQEKDFARQTAQDVLANLVQMHQQDTDASFIMSPVYGALEKKASDARMAWEKAKEDMVARFIPEEVQPHVANWNLDYGSCELSLVIQGLSDGQLAKYGIETEDGGE